MRMYCEVSYIYLHCVNIQSINNLFIQDEPDSSCVEQLHISAKEAFNKFKGKQIVGKPVDFSDRLSSKPRTGYKQVLINNIILMKFNI